MHQYKFQIPKRSKELRGQLFSYLYKHCDVKTIERPEEIEIDRYLAFSHPFDDWVFDAISKDRRINFFHLDNGYIGNHRHKTPLYYRISYNSLQNTKVRPPVNKSRIEYLEIDDDLWKEWNEGGDYNLLVMPNNSNIFKYLGEDYSTWRTNTVRHYDSLPEKLIIREKEGKRRQRFQEILPMMLSAKKVITYHSMAVVEALCLGKPIEVLGQSAVQHWQGQFGFDRKPMLEHIAHSQFSRKEYEDGTAWETTFKYQVEQDV
ncbi:MAG: hypothetical protein CMD92_08680 [Gammaproteobacteria bacterium]|jgi:hypothetical protein|nr:hypothetical protein [Gammaproteobacteria bacterium]